MNLPQPTSQAATSVIVIDNLIKTYGKVRVLQGLNLTVQAGEVYGFLGRNGAGKSTTIRIIMGITRASRGAVHLFGRPLRSQDTALRQHIGYVAQEQNFYGWMTPKTIGHFVSGFYPSWDTPAYLQFLKNLDLPPNQKLRTFSGGMRAKLALALALAHQPPVLVLDEPTAGLDAVARREFIELVRGQAEETGRTTFFSSHLIDEVELAADRVGIIDAGKMRYEGALTTLSNSIRLFTQPLKHEPLAPLTDVLPTRFVSALSELTDSSDTSGLTILQDRVRQGERQVVIQARDPAQFDPPLQIGCDWEMKRLSLEDIFIEMVSKPLA